MFRGGDVAGKVVFTKDVVYLRGLLGVHTFFLKAIERGRPELIHHLFAGRMALGDALELDPFFRSGALAPPRFEPTWVRSRATLAAFLEVARPLADAVAAAHARGITHRDLKPGNVMITGDGRLKVLDFGLAKLTANDSAADSGSLPTGQLTGHGQILGTVAYMSPEQAEGKPVDDRSDIFSLGIILYEVATGRRPFTGDSAASLVSSILRDTPPPVTDTNPAIPARVARLIERCLARDRDPV